MARLTQLQRDRVATFLSSVVEWSGKKWDDIANEAYREGVPYTTIQGWRYKRSTPEGPGLVEFLRAAGLLDSDYKLTVQPLPATRPAEAGTAATAAKDALDLAHQASRSSSPRRRKAS